MGSKSLIICVSGCNLSPGGGVGIQLESVALPSQATMMLASNPSATQLGLEDGWAFGGVTGHTGHTRCSPTSCFYTLSLQWYFASETLQVLYHWA